MDFKKHDRNVRMLCPTCGGTEFSYEQDITVSMAAAKCLICGRELTKDDLLRENSENVSLHVEDLKKDVLPDAVKQVKEALQKAFKGSKNFRIG